MYTIRTDYRDETVIEKSRFICTLKKVSSETEAQDFIKAVKKEFWDATHNCSAYIIDELAQRSSDDGEPSGTAGLPMLEVLRKNQLSGVAAVVTRYFGGIKLGVRGLIDAYGLAADLALQAAGRVKRTRVKRLAVSLPYAMIGSVTRLLEEHGAVGSPDWSYASEVDVTADLPMSSVEALTGVLDEFQARELIVSWRWL